MLFLLVLWSSLSGSVQPMILLFTTDDQGAGVHRATRRLVFDLDQCSFLFMSAFLRGLASEGRSRPCEATTKATA